MLIMVVVALPLSSRALLIPPKVMSWSLLPLEHGEELRTLLARLLSLAVLRSAPMAMPWVILRKPLRALQTPCGHLTSTRRSEQRLLLLKLRALLPVLTRQ